MKGWRRPIAAAITLGWLNTCVMLWLLLFRVVEYDLMTIIVLGIFLAFSLTATAFDYMELECGREQATIDD